MPQEALTSYVVASTHSALTRRWHLMAEAPESLDRVMVIAAIPTTRIRLPGRSQMSQAGKKISYLLLTSATRQPRPDLRPAKWLPCARKNNGRSARAGVEQVIFSRYPTGCWKTPWSCAGCYQHDRGHQPDIVMTIDRGGTSAPPGSRARARPRWTRFTPPRMVIFPEQLVEGVEPGVSNRLTCFGPTIRTTGRIFPVHRYAHPRPDHHAAR